MRKTREERKWERSQKSSRAATLGWERIHAAKSAAGIVEIYEDVHAYGPYEITIKSISSGKINVLYLGEGGTRRDNFSADLNGKPWEPRIASISDVTRFVRKAIVKTRSGRIV